MRRFSSIEALGDPASVHLLEFGLSPDVLGGARPRDRFDGERIREAANLIKRVCSKQKILGEYTVTPVRSDTASIRCGFLNDRERDLIADLAGAGIAPSPSPWASVRHFLLDLDKEEALNAAGIPRDNRGPGRRARERADEMENDKSLRWLVRGEN